MEPESFIMESKHACTLLQRERLFLSFKTICLQTSLKDSLEQSAVSVSHVRHPEI